MEEHEQKGVTVPKRAAIVFAPTPLNLPSILLDLSGGKKLCIIEIPKIRMDRRMKILMVSYIKKCRLPPMREAISSLKTFSIRSWTSL
jgi:hypothetical protein